MKAIFTSFTLQKTHKERAQAIAEFAIVLPILMVILVGILEAGRMVFMYAAVNNASREAARYASAYGLNDASPGVEKYRDCDGIRDRARRSAFFVPLTITIYHDDGVTNANPPVPINRAIYCSGVPVDSYKPTSGQRITVEVNATYSPMVRLIPFPTRNFTSTSSRTVLGVMQFAYP